MPRFWSIIENNVNGLAYVFVPLDFNPHPRPMTEFLQQRLIKYHKRFGTPVLSAQEGF